MNTSRDTRLNEHNTRRFDRSHCSWSTFVTPRPRESTVHDTVGVYKSTKCHIEIILETKVGNERLWNPEFVVFKPRVQLSFSKKI